MTAYERLREADPLPPVPDAPPPEDVLAAIVATPREPVRRRRRRLVLVPAALAVAVGAVALVLLPGGGKPDLAARAYAAMSPGDSILHVVETLRYTSSRPDEPYWPRGEEPPRYAWCCGRSDDESSTESWQRGKEAHRIWRSRYSWSGRGEVQVTESAIGEDDVIRYLGLDGRVQTVRPGDERSESSPQELREGFVSKFRGRYADRALRDAGTSTFDGKPARRYVVEHPTREVPPALTSLPYVVTNAASEEYFLDAGTGLPLGTVRSNEVRRPDGSILAQSRSIVTVKLVEQLEPTPDNLAKLRPDWTDRPDVNPGRAPRGSRAARRQRDRAARRSSRAARDGG